MARRTIELPLTIIDHEVDAAFCGRCIEDRLVNRAGVHEARVQFKPANGQRNESISVLLDYDPQLVSLAEIDRYVRATGACMDRSLIQLVIPVNGMTSPSHEPVIEKALMQLSRVSATASYASKIIRVEFDHHCCPIHKILDTLRQLGLDVPQNWLDENTQLLRQLNADESPDQSSFAHGLGPAATSIASPPVVSPDLVKHPEPAPSAARVTSASTWAQALREPDVVLAINSGLFLLLGFLVHMTADAHVIRITLLSISYLCGGWYPAKDLIQTLRHPRLNIDVLMLAAAVGAAVLGHYEEGALLLFLFSIGGAGERLAMDHARGAIKALSQLAPETARLVDDTGREYEVRVENLRVGDQIVVRPGQRIAADGKITAGISAIDQSPISGESIGVEKTVDDEVFAGTLNGTGLLKIRVSKPAGETTLAKISRMVQEAQTTKSPTQQVTDQIEEWYVPLIIVITALIWVVPPLMGWQSVRDVKPWAGWFYQAMAFLTAASPCALAIGTPAAILSGIARAAWAGVLVKGGAQLENLGRIQVIAFDKTGTLTNGHPQITDAISMQSDVSTDQLLALTASVENGSSHPLANAIVTATRSKKIEIPIATNITQTPGMGITGLVHGQTIAVGRPAMFAANMSGHDAAVAAAMELENHGKTTIIIAQEQRIIGVIALADEPRNSASTMISQIKSLGIKRTIMLTGDNRRTAAAIAKSVGIDEFLAELFPQDKLDKVRELDKKYGHVAMVGDGVNDAPALANATVGIAITGASRTGSDVALETADVALLSDDLVKLPQAIGISRFTRRIVVQNLVIALGVIAVLAPMAGLGHTTIGVAVLFHEGSTVLVVLNALRILKYKTTR